MFKKIKEMLNKKPQVVFKATVPGIDTVMPIIPAREYKPKWLSNARADFSKQIAGGYPSSKVRSVHKCPGIVDLLNSGWIVRAWQDITISTNGDGESVRWWSPMNFKEFTPIEDLAFMPGDLLLNYLPKRVDTLKSIVKFQAPWLVNVPKGYSLMFMPMLFSDDGRFTTCPGVLDTEIDSQLSIQMFWHAMNSTEVIRAGTPIAHLILVPSDNTPDLKLVPFSSTTRAEVFIESLKNSSTNLIDYNKRN